MRQKTNSRSTKRAATNAGERGREGGGGRMESQRSTNIGERENSEFKPHTENIYKSNNAYRKHRKHVKTKQLILKKT